MLLELNASYNGEAWHGTSFRILLDGIDEGRARAHPVPGARSIAELVTHVTAWMEIARRRLGGEAVNVSREMDSPTVDQVPWQELLARLEAANSRLLDAVARLQDDDFDRKVPGKDYTAGFMLQGVVSHNAYHGGQIALLRK